MLQIAGLVTSEVVRLRSLAHLDLNAFPRLAEYFLRTPDALTQGVSAPRQTRAETSDQGKATEYYSKVSRPQHWAHAGVRLVQHGPMRGRSIGWSQSLHASLKKWSKPGDRE